MDKKILLIIILGALLIGAGIFVGVMNAKKIDLDSTVNQLTELNATLSRDIQQRIVELGLARSEVDTLTSRNTELQGINGELEESNKRLRGIADNLTTENKQLRDTIGQLRDTTGQLRTANTELKQRIGNVKQLVEGAGRSSGTAEELIAEIIILFRNLRKEIEGQ
jgi:methyl-accepting chemotaxis protein